MRNARIFSGDHVPGVEGHQREQASATTAGSIGVGGGVQALSICFIAANGIEISCHSSVIATGAVNTLKSATASRWSVSV